MALFEASGSWFFDASRERPAVPREPVAPKVGASARSSYNQGLRLWRQGKIAAAQHFRAAAELGHGASEPLGAVLVC